MRIVRLAPTLLLVLAACHQQPRLAAEHGWVRLPAVPGRPAAAYLTVQGGPVPVRLVAVESEAAGSAELHESMKTGPGGMAGMRRLDGLDVPARATVGFAPGGNHVMLFGLSPSVKPGDRIPLHIRFEKGPPLAIEAQVVGAGDPAP